MRYKQLYAKESAFMDAFVKKMYKLKLAVNKMDDKVQNELAQILNDFHITDINEIERKLTIKDFHTFENKIHDFQEKHKIKTEAISPIVSQE